MELIIQEIIQKISSSYKKELENLIRERRDISEFILANKKTLDEIGATLVAEALETVDEVYKDSKDRKRYWEVKEKAATKTLTTIFGAVRYERTYYKNKRTGEYSYLSDEAVGIKAHDKLDASLKAKLVEEAVFMPYSSSANKAAEAVDLTSQTVMNSIRELGSVYNDAVEVKQDKRSVKVLYIEADEDHVALQKGGSVEPKLVYIHEGRKKAGKNRWKLINARYFSGVYANSDKLWVEVLDYIDKAYDMDAIEKYVTQATAHMDYTTSIMWDYINSGDKESVKELFKAIISTTEPETKKRAVQESRRYILGNWEGIMRQYETDYAGCSAEGHVSHILSSRLRVFVANGGNVYDVFMQKKKAAINEARQVKVEREIIRKRKLTDLNIGKRTWAFQLLKSVRDA